MEVVPFLAMMATSVRSEWEKICYGGGGGGFVVSAGIYAL